MPGLALGFFLFERVYQLDGGEEENLAAVMIDGLSAEGRRNMGFSGTSGHRPAQRSVRRR